MTELLRSNFAMSKRIKIIRVVVGLNNGGVQQMVLNLFKGLNKNLFEPVALAIENTGAIGYEIEQAGFKVINLGLHRDNFSFLKIIRTLQKVFMMEKPDIVHASSYYPSIYARIAAKLAAVPVLISHEHTVFTTKRPKRQIISHLVSGFTDLHIAVGIGVREQLIDWYRIPESKVAVVYNGVNTAVFKRTLPVTMAKENLDIPLGAFVIGYVGRLDPGKGHKYLFQAIREIRGKFNLCCIIAGTGRHEDYVKRLAEDSGISDITRFLGLRRDIPDLLSAMDVFVLPSFQEGFSNALIEAMAVGCPVIASDIHGNNEAVKNGENGLLVPPGDSSALKGSLETLITNDEIRLEMSQAAMKKVEERFSMKRHIETMERIYFTLFENKGLV